jgi:hypothetical protein
MVIQNEGFWWEDFNCLMSNIQENKIAPICQYEIASHPTTITIPDDTTTSMTTTSATVVACIGQREEFDGHMYFFSDFTVSVSEAKQCCILEGSQLVSIHSPEEDLFLFVKSGVGLWTGGTRSTPEVMPVLGPS